MPAVLVTKLDAYPNADGTSFDMEITVVMQHPSITGRRRRDSFGANIDLTPATFYSSIASAVIAHAQAAHGVTFNANQIAMPEFIRGS